MKKYSDICEEINIEPPSQQLIKIKYISKILHEREVDQILEKFVINPRVGTKIYMRDPHKMNSKASLIRHINLYNALPLELKMLNPERLKRRLQKLNVSFKD